MDGAMVFPALDGPRTRRRKPGLRSAFLHSVIILMIAIIQLTTPAFWVSPAAAERTPLLIPGKRTLYQRVLTRPEAVLRERPAANAAVTRERIAPLTPLYVYDHSSI